MDVDGQEVWRRETTRLFVTMDTEGDGTSDVEVEVSSLLDSAQ